MKRTRSSSITAIAAAALCLAAAMGPLLSCADGQRDLPALSLQPTRRFPLGSTFYLPAPAGGRWVRDRAPSGDENEVVAGQDGYYRFTPVVPGDYTFRLDTTGETRSLTAVADAPYEHFNYSQNTSLAEVDGEIWVSHLFDPHLSRIDPVSGQLKGTIRTGPWPVALAHVKSRGIVLVAHKAGDTVGFIDVARGRLVDSVWVGDEPAAVAVSPDGSKAYVSLATEDAVVAIDLATRAVVGKLAANKTPGALAISADGSTLYVASNVSAVSDRLQFPAEPRNDQYDIAVVDTASLSVKGYIPSVGSVIAGLWIDGARLYVSTTRIAPAELSLDEGMTAFRHTVAVYDTTTLDEVVAVDVGRQDTSTGLAVRPVGLIIAHGMLWVTCEGSDIVVGLDPDTLAEQVRFPAAGRPRAIIAHGDRLFVHGAQAYRVTVATTSGTHDKELHLQGDPRSPGIAAGQKAFTGAGARGGLNHSCADCHPDGLTDGNMWPAGFSRSESRPMWWLESPKAIGWEGDGYDLYSYLWAGPGPTIGVTLTTELHQAFFEYLSALVPPPHQNGWTERDGSMSEAARRGEALFRGQGRCAGCHQGPLGTSGIRLDGGGTQRDHPIVVPGLVGSYRHGHWLVNGAAWSLEESIDAMLPLAGATLDGDQKRDLARYLRELTSRTFFVLDSVPANGTTDARDEGALRVFLSHPVFDEPSNLGRIQLSDASGEPLDITVKADGRYLTITPGARLRPGSEYALVLQRGFEAWNERTLESDAVIRFTVARPPAMKLEGSYTLTVQHPALDVVNRRYDTSTIIPVTTTFTATPTDYGAELDAAITPVLKARLHVTIAGEKSLWPPIPFPFGAEFVNRSYPTEMMLVDEDSDGVADTGTGTLMFRGGGLEVAGVRWTILHDRGGPQTCHGQTGANPVTVTLSAQGTPTVEWGAGVSGLSLFVTSPDAQTPLGPTPVVTGGTTYWGIATNAFPNGFMSPVSYGVVPAGANDVSEASSAPLGGAPLPSGACIKLTLVFSDFSATTAQYVVP